MRNCYLELGRTVRCNNCYYYLRYCTWYYTGYCTCSHSQFVLWMLCSAQPTHASLCSSVFLLCSTHAAHTTCLCSYINRLVSISPGDDSGPRALLPVAKTLQPQNPKTPSWVAESNVNGRHQTWTWTTNSPRPWSQAGSQVGSLRPWAGLRWRLDA